jgi:parallel beta-helix repeat protein
MEVPPLIRLVTTAIVQSRPAMARVVLHSLATSLVLALLLGSSTSVAQPAQPPPVDCDRGQSITSALAALRPGDTLQVAGTCRENVLIGEYLMAITIDGQGSAVLTPADPETYTLTIRGRGITIRGFTINGSSEVVYIRDGGSAVIDGNTIQGGINGVFVTRSSSAHIVNNTIQANSQSGILINENSSARIGFVLAEDREASPNIVRSNGTTGITVTRASNARMVGNIISNNARDGIAVNRVSVAEISANTIEGNLGDGIAVSQGSGVHLGRDTGSGIIDRPNTGENAGVGVSCTINSYADGRLGELDDGEVRFETGSGTDGGCVNSLIP